ncbi:molecular chaperone DnaJ [Propionibacterium cyclohexanicum]|uniref:Chaperone protein DnaJ n=1 Tax=Propionibacterium cyclohexanicum TaxID=64702 RepID=A0A1H9S026_9ACTN|nr:molecular chaperone DnaJ [Propionibacterium cyclohexanicum]SER78278.1 molecular chaperone DnaJ [Propionibacterium cyclohexanicum]
MSTKDWLEKDYYKVLGVPKDAKPEQIKKAFRKIARENHPDQHPGDARAEERFKEASEANDVLSDAAKRKEYDETRRLGGGFHFPHGSQGGAGGVNDIFRTMGGGATMGEGGLGDLLGGLFNQGPSTARRTTMRSARRGADVEGEVTISFLDSVKGTTVGMQMVSDEPCPACRGTGAKAGTMPRMCPTCQGSGMQPTSAGGVFSLSEPCHTCHGRGLVVDDPCEVCHGSGRATSTRTMQVRVPAGVTDGQRIRVKGKGSRGENGGANGDLYVVVHVNGHPIFGRSGDNLTVTVPVTFPEAALGAEVEVPTLQSGPVKLRVPAGTPNGRTFRVRGRGVSKANGEYGDLLVTIEVQVPSSLSSSAKEALEAYRAAVREANPRVNLVGESR